MVAMHHLGVGVDEELVGVEPVAGLIDVGAVAFQRAGVERLRPRPVGAPGDVAVMLTLADALHVEVEDILELGHGELLGGPVRLGVVEQ